MFDLDDNFCIQAHSQCQTTTPSESCAQTLANAYLTLHCIQWGGKLPLSQCKPDIGQILNPFNVQLETIVDTRLGNG